MRRVALTLIAVSMLGVGIVTAGPASAAKKPVKITSCKKDKQLNQHIQAAFATFFVGETAQDKMVNVQDGQKILAAEEKANEAANASGQGNTATTTTYPVKIVAKCDGKTSATFTYDLALKVPKPVTAVPSTGAGLNFAGDAVLVKGKWLITGGTVCDLIGANPATPGLGAECTAALG